MPGKSLMPCPALFLLALLSASSAFAATEPKSALKLEAPRVIYAVGLDGKNLLFTDRASVINYVRSNSPCAEIKVEGKYHPCIAAASQSNDLTLHFADTAMQAVVRISGKGSYLVWEVVSVTGTNVEEFVFANVPLSLSGSPGEPFAAAAMALNLKT